MPPPASPHFLVLSKQTPTEDQVFECLRLKGAGHLLQTITIPFIPLSKFVPVLQYLLFEHFARHTFIFFFLFVRVVYAQMHACVGVQLPHTRACGGRRLVWNVFLDGSPSSFLTHDLSLSLRIAFYTRLPSQSGIPWDLLESTCHLLAQC